MKQRGRQSTASLATVTAIPQRMLAPPADLTAEECGVWARVTATKPGDWWDAGSLPLLVQYCRAVVQSDAVALQVSAVSPFLATPEGLPMYKELRKIQATLSAEISSLATKMRLTQQSRYTAQSSSTANAKAPGGRKPWERHDVIDS